MKHQLISLQLEKLSLQCLIWIIKSIKNDLMTPTEKLILSRIKETFALKLTPKSWELVIQHIQQIQGIRSNHELSNSTIISQLVITNAKDPLLESDTIVIYILNEEWVPEDQEFQKPGTYEETEPWVSFVQFLNNYFNQPVQTIDANNYSKLSKFNNNQNTKNNSNKKKKIIRTMYHHSLPLLKLYLEAAMAVLNISNYAEMKFCKIVL